MFRGLDKIDDHVEQLKFYFTTVSARKERQTQSYHCSFILMNMKARFQRPPDNTACTSSRVMNYRFFVVISCRWDFMLKGELIVWASLYLYTRCTFGLQPYNELCILMLRFEFSFSEYRVPSFVHI